MDFHVYSLNSIDYLGKIIREMKGDVFLCIGKNTPLNLTKEPGNLEILRCMKIGSSNVTLRITNPADRDSMVKYLIRS